MFLGFAEGLAIRIALMGNRRALARSPSWGINGVKKMGKPTGSRPNLTPKWGIQLNNGTSY